NLQVALAELTILHARSPWPASLTRRAGLHCGAIHDRFFAAPGMTTPTSRARQADFLIVGGGIAGASAAHWLAPHGKVILLERESQPGYHSTGRSAALFMESYGTPQVRALTCASRAFLDHPPAGFSEYPLLSPRGAMIVAAPGQEHLLQQHWDVLRTMSPAAQLLNGAQTCAQVSVLRPSKVAGGVLEPDAADMDVHAIPQVTCGHCGAPGGRWPATRESRRCNAGQTSGRSRPAASGTRRRWCSTQPAPGPTKLRSWQACRASACSRGAAQPSSSPRLKEWTSRAGRWCWARVSTG